MLICCRLFPLAQKPMVLGTSHNCLQNRSDNDIKQTMVPHVHRCGSSYIDANSTKQNTMLPNLTLPRVPNVLPKRDRNSETTMGSTCAIVAPSTDGACNILTAPVHNAHLMLQTRRHPRWGPPCRSPALPAFRCPTERGGGVLLRRCLTTFGSVHDAPNDVRHLSYGIGVSGASLQLASVLAGSIEVGINRRIVFHNWPWRCKALPRCSAASPWRRGTQLFHG